jgi:hypothetical protein
VSALTVVAAIAMSAPGWLLLDVLLIPVAIVFGALGDWNRVTSSVVERHLGVVPVKAPSAAFSAALAGAWSPTPPMTLAPQRGW